jgi:thiol-disulfide isomerase/thioredoxin
MKSFTAVILLLFFSFIGKGNGQTTIMGRVLGYDSLPLTRADIHLSKFDSKEPFTSQISKKDGSFHILTNQSGLVKIEISGVNHYSYECPIFLVRNKSIRIDAILKHYEYADSITAPIVIGDFNKFNLYTGKPLQRQADGTFTISFPTSADTFAYQLVGIEKYNQSHSINNMSDFYVYDGGGDYRSISLPEKGIATVVFDPKKLTRTRQDDRVKISVDNTPLKYLVAQKFISDHQRRFEYEEQRAAGDPKALLSPVKAYVAVLASREKKAESKIEKQLYLIQFLEYSLIGLQLGESFNDPSTLNDAFNELPATSELWEIHPDAAAALLAIDKFSIRSKNYINVLVKHGIDDATISQVLFTAIYCSRTFGDSIDAMAYYSELMSTYPKSDWATMAKQSFASNSPSLVSKQVPTFVLSAVGNSSIPISDTDFRNKYLLIDFWATWCGPCIAEIPGLTKAFNKFHNNNLELLSISLDSSTQVVQDFRKSRYSMPWLHAITSVNSDLARKFGVVGIPSSFLVSPDGIVLASGDDLRGANLEKTLAKFLEKKG